MWLISKSTKEYLTLSVTNKFLKMLNVNVTFSTLKNILENDPRFPNMFSIADSLSTWGIENHVIHVKRDDFKEIPTPCLVEFNQEKDTIGIIKTVDNNRVEWWSSSNGTLFNSVEEFENKCTGIFLIAQPSENAGEKDFKLKYREMILRNVCLLSTIIIGFLVFFIISICLFQTTEQISLVILFFIKLLGSFITLLLINHEFQQDDSLISQVCSTKKLNSDCNKILASQEAEIIGIKWTDLGLFYFIGSIFILLFSIYSILPFSAILSCLNLMCLIFSCYSIWYQAFKAKEWCYFCLVTLLLFGLEFFLLIPFINFELLFSIKTIASTLVSFSLSAFITSYVRLFLNEKYELKKIKAKFNAFKYDSEIFDKLLQTGRVIHTKGIFLQPIYAKNSEFDKHSINIVTNPFCKPCFQTHQQIEDLLITLSKKITINFIFSINPFENDKSDANKVIRKFVSLHKYKGQQIANEAINAWYSEKYFQNYTEWSNQYPIENEDVDDIISNLKRWTKESRIDYTPTIIVNNRQLPRYYQLSDLKYLL